MAVVSAMFRQCNNPIEASSPVKLRERGHVNLHDRDISCKVRLSLNAVITGSRYTNGRFA
jgi:acetylglutamate synthase